MFFVGEIVFLIYMKKIKRFSILFDKILYFDILDIVV